MGALFYAKQTSTGSLDPVISSTRPRSVENHASDRFARVHEVERLIDSLKRHGVGDEIVDIDLLFHVPVNDFRDVGAAPRAAERRALPHPAGNELKRSRLDLLTCAGDADDDRHAPATVAALQCLAHHVDVADAFDAVVDAAIRKIEETRD